MKYYTVILCTLFCCFSLFSQNALTLQSIRIDPTLQHISINCSIIGDSNRNSTMQVFFREANSVDSFESGGMSMRAYPGMIVDGSSQSRNFHAASVLFLEPEKDYDIIVSLTDPDGGSQTDTITARTASIPKASANGTIKYVSPGSGGGTGTDIDPYLGLQAAATAAQPGDVFRVRSGNYSSFEILASGSINNPIVFTSDPLHHAIIDGAGTDRGAITLGVYNDSIQHIILDGFIIQNAKWGIDAQNTQHVMVRNCMLRDVDFGYYNRRANGWEHHQYLTNNSFTGRTVWPQLNGEIPGERGISISGNRNIISHNFLTNFGDGISTDGPPYGTNYAMDIHHNDITKIVDDLIEVDGMVSNARVYRNRGYDGRMGVSVAPVFGGPCYIFRNEFFNLENSTIKMNRDPAGLVVVHNTAVKTENGLSSPNGWQNTYYRNNLFLATWYCFEYYGLVVGSVDDWNNNAYYSTRAGTNGDPWFKWENTRYNDVAHLSTSAGIEANGIEAGLPDLTNAAFPTNYGQEYLPAQRDLSLSPNSNLLDTGMNIVHLNQPFVLDGKPDIGALEYGLPLPQYGPDFDFVSDIEIQLGSSDISIYPNPVNHFLHITGTLADYSIRILNSTGGIVRTISSNGNQVIVDISSLGQGLYFIQLEHKTNTLINVHTIIKF